MIQKRKLPRVSISQKVQLRYRDENDKLLRKCLLMDISEGGFCIGVEMPLRKDREYIFELQLPFLEIPTVARGEMRWQGQEPGSSMYRGWLAGIKLSSPLPQKVREELGQYIERKTHPEKQSDIHSAIAAKLGLSLPIVMLVDQGEELEKRMKTILAEDAEIVRCQLEVEAVEMAKDLKPKTVIVNLESEVVGEPELIKRFKSEELLKNIPVAAISDSFTKEQAKACQEAGAASLIIASMSDDLIKSRVTQIAKLDDPFAF